MKKILIIHGPNLNLLGTRERELYGSETLRQIEASLNRWAKEKGVVLEFFQSNAEGEIVDCLQAAAVHFDAIVINPAAFTHTSVAIADAVRAIPLPVVEVHLSNIKAREEFREKSYLSPVAAGVVFGFGSLSYQLGLEGALALTSRGKKKR